jgi:hypothetical protein
MAACAFISLSFAVFGGGPPGPMLVVFASLALAWLASRQESS